MHETASDPMSHLRLPVMAAPMTMASSLELVIACCRAGVIGGLQAATAGTPEDLANWIDAIEAARRDAFARGERFAPYMVNLLAAAGQPQGSHRRRLEYCRERSTPLLLTTGGDPTAVVREAHSWGARVFHDVTTIGHIDRAVGAGVDGLMLVAGGSGGLAGTLNPFAFVAQARKRFNGVIILAGGIADGRGVAAALTLGADLVCMGTRFIATAESGAPDAYRAMLVACGSDDVLYTDAIAGIPGSFLRPSIRDNGLDPESLPRPKARFQPDLPENVKPWRSVWSAGHSVGLIEDAPSVATVVSRLEAELAEHAPSSPWRETLASALGRGGEPKSTPPRTIARR